MESYKHSVETVADLAVVKVEGFLDAHTAPELEKVLNELLEKKQYQVVLDLLRLEYISSAGFGVLMGAISSFRENKGDLKLVQLPPRVYKVFDLLGFTKLFQVFDTLAEATAAFEKEKGRV